MRRMFDRLVIKLNPQMRLVLVGETPTRFVVDSGAGVNIIDSHSFDELCQNEDFSLLTTDMELYTYGSDTPLKLRGKINCQISHKDESVPADIYVVNSKYSGYLLGKDTAEELGILRIDKVQKITGKELDKPYKWTKEMIAKKYPNIVNEVGRLKVK